MTELAFIFARTAPGNWASWRRWSGPWSPERAEAILTQEIQPKYPDREFRILPSRKVMGQFMRDGTVHEWHLPDYSSIYENDPEYWERGR